MNKTMDKTLARFLVTLFSISWLIPAWVAVYKIARTGRVRAGSSYEPLYLNRDHDFDAFLWFAAVLAFWVWRLYPLIGDRCESALPADPARGGPPPAPSPQEPKA